MRHPFRCAIAALALFATACAEDNNGDDGPIDDGWTVENPPRYAYADQTPRADIPEDPAQWNAYPVPYPQIGGDTGEPGIVYSAVLAGYYLMRIQWDEQGYHYEYDPVAGEFTEADNIHRKCGATFTQIWLYRFTRRPEFAMSTRAAIEYLLSKGAQQDDGTFRLRDLGGTSLITLSTTEYARLLQTDEYDAVISQLGEHLLGRIQPDGSFSEGKPLQWAQAHQALWRLYSYTGDTRYLDALESVGRYFYDNRENPEVIDFPYLYGLWANEPLTDLYKVRPADWIAQFVLEVGDDVASKQHVPGDDVDPTWIGGYWANSGRDGEPGWNATLKLEAVIDAYRMAVIVDDAEHIERFRKSAIVGTEFLMNMQHRAGETSGFPEGDFVNGGTPYSPTDPRVRLDVPHHMANAILKVVEYIDLEDYPGR